METIYLIGVVVCAVITIYWLGNYMRKKGWIKKEDHKRLANILAFVATLVKSINIDNNTRDKSLLILDVANEAADYVFKTMSDISLSDKITISLDIVSKMLFELNIKTTVEQDKLIRIVVSESLQFFESKKMSS